MLPVFGFQTLHGLGDGLEVFLVEKMSTERATPLHQFGCWVIVDSLTTLSVNALEIGTQKRCINHPGSEFFRIFKTDPFMGLVFSKHE